MTKNNFELYAKYKLQIADLEKKIEELQPLILAEMPDKPVELEDIGVFSMGSRKTWTFSDVLNAKEEALKEWKKTEMQTGAATFVEKPYLLFKAKK